MAKTGGRAWRRVVNASTAADRISAEDTPHSSHVMATQQLPAAAERTARVDQNVVWHLGYMSGFRGTTPLPPNVAPTCKMW